MKILIKSNNKDFSNMDAVNCCGGDVCPQDCPNDYCTGDNGACPDETCWGDNQDTGDCTIGA